MDGLGKGLKRANQCETRNLGVVPDGPTQALPFVEAALNL